MWRNIGNPSSFPMFQRIGCRVLLRNLGFAEGFDVLGGSGGMACGETLEILSFPNVSKNWFSCSIKKHWSCCGFFVVWSIWLICMACGEKVRILAVSQCLKE